MKSYKFAKLLLAGILCLTTMTIAFGEIATDAKLQYNKGVDYYKLGQFEESANCFKRAIDLDPNYIDAYYNLGSILEYLNQKEAALSVFKQIILRRPEDYEAVFKAAVLSKNLGEYEKAKMYLTLIPLDSKMGAPAQQLAAEMETTLAELQTQQKQEEAAKEEELTDGMYEDITSPTGLVTDKNGNLYIAGFSENTIFKIGPDNKKIVYIKSEKIDGPIGLAIDDNNNIYIANYNKNNVLKVDTNGTITEFATDIQSPYCLYINNNMLFISSQGSNTVIRRKLVR